jgi:hypothetical protein
LSHDLSANFVSFFSKLNPSQRFRDQAARQYATVKKVLEDHCVLEPICFLQGSYREHTAIHTINDVDIVVLCKLWQPGARSTAGGPGWDRDSVFAAVAAPLLERTRYAGKVHYGPRSMCIKVDLGIKLELLPAVFASGNLDPAQEPFRLYRPSTGQWADGFAREHQARLSKKNADCNGNFIPAVKVMKHLRSLLDLSTVSFHIECLLYALPHEVYRGRPDEYIPAMLDYLAYGPRVAFTENLTTTPCGERRLFTPTEFSEERWQEFSLALGFWEPRARAARGASNRREAVANWKMLLGDQYFPDRVV